MLFVNQRLILMVALTFGLLSACQTSQSLPDTNQRLNVVATTSIVGDVVKQIGGDLINLTVLLPPGTDPHSFQPAPQDLALVADADLIFANGAGLEEFLNPLLESAGGDAVLVEVSDGVTILEAEDPGLHSLEEKNLEHAGDPHTWFDPENVIVWVDNIKNTLMDADLENRDVYAENAQGYQQQLKDLDGWIQDQVQKIPAENRKLVTDHTSLTYFAQRYGFEQVGAVIPAYSTLAETSAQELADLEDLILAQGVKAVFVGESVNSALAERVAQDTGVKLVRLHNGSLSDSQGTAATYLDFMRSNVAAIVEALK